MNRGFSRRYFFFGSLFAGAMPVGGFGSVKSLRALGYKPFYDKLNVAGIGVGGRGGAILNQAARTENVVALCDVDEARGAEGFERYPNAPRYTDFREMLDNEPDIEACTIGIPDHMHATVAFACMERGKNVYVEKPLTRTPWEARLLTKAAERYNVATQMGNQGYSHESIRVAAEIVWSGEIGDVTEVHVSSSPGTHPTGLQELPPESEVPAELDWDLWLGGASMRPFSDAYVPYNWRGFYDFGTGQIGNWGTHTLGPVNLALQLGAPTSIELIQDEGRSSITFPHRAVVRMDFPARGGLAPVSLYWHDSPRIGDPEAYEVPGMAGETILPPANNLVSKGRPAGEGPEALPAPRPPAPSPPKPAAPKPSGPPVGAGGPGVRVYEPPGGRRLGSEPGYLVGNGAVFIGTNGIMATTQRGEGVHLLPESRWADYELPPPTLTRSPGHMLDWLRAAKGGDRSCSDFSIAGPFAEWVALLAIAMRVPGQRLEWDSANLRFTNSDEANRLVKPMFREGWEPAL